MAGHDRERDAPPVAEPGWKLRLEERLGLLDDLELIAFDGHGTERFLSIKGRLVEKKGLAGSLGPDGSRWQNVLNTLRRLESDEIPGARIRARFRDLEWDTWTDEEGYFRLNIYVDEPLEPGWQDVGFELLESVKEGARAQITGRALVPRRDAEFAVVSDLDDTMIRTGATDLVTEIRTVFAHDAHTRAPFAGAAEFYTALQRGPDDRGANPIFYVSRSGWNMYDLFVEFFDHHELPRGPMFLQDLAVREDKSAAVGAEHHKLNRLRRLLRDYPDLPFVLMGDSGQHDPETYRRIVLENPGRVKAICIRDVSEPERDAEVDAIARQLRDRGVVFVRAAHSLELAQAAAEHGLIARSGVRAVQSAHDRYRASEDQV